MTPNNQTATATATAIHNDVANAAIVYLTLQQFTEKHPAFRMGTLRHYVFFENDNGLKKAGAVVRLGRRVLLNETKFFAWLEAQNQGAAV